MRRSWIRRCFNSRAPWGARPVARTDSQVRVEFQFTRPAGGATGSRRRVERGEIVSIHAPRGGRDPSGRRHPTHAGVSIHAPRGGRDLTTLETGVKDIIVSIHAPRGGRDRTRKRNSPFLPLFQFTRPVGGATPGWRLTRSYQSFQFTRPVGGATSGRVRPLSPSSSFQFTRPVGGATDLLALDVAWEVFQFTRPVGGATPHARLCGRVRGVSIHAPRGGRDLQVLHDLLDVVLVSIHAPRGGRDGSAAPTRTSSSGFNSRAPWGARPAPKSRAAWHSRFNSRAPWGARRDLRREGERRGGVSIHAPRGGRDLLPDVAVLLEPVSIHAPRGGRDSSVSFPSGAKVEFQFTRPVGGATRGASSRATTTTRFNSRAPWGARRSSPSAIPNSVEFQFTRPVGGATWAWGGFSAIREVSIHAPRGGRDARQSCPCCPGTGFNSRAPWGARPGSTTGCGTRSRFNSRAPWGARRPTGRVWPFREGFNSRAPWGARLGPPFSLL